jgi:amidase
MTTNKLRFAVPIILASFLVAACSGPPQSVVAEDRIVEADVADLQSMMESSELSSEALVRTYLARIDRFDGELNSVIAVNPSAVEQAAALDDERAAGKVRGPLHGIPVLLKDNIESSEDIPTTAGSLALEGNITHRDAFLVERLRQAGAVILGKANLSEWANFRSERSSSGWSGVGGQTLNPYDPTRSPCGSSSGSAVAVAANLAALAVGTETNGSVVCPATVNGVVGIKPTVGLVSRTGIVPISHSQDTAGPFGRTLSDAVLLLAAMIGVDENDAVTEIAGEASEWDLTAHLMEDGLEGKRIGVLPRSTSCWNRR